VRNDDGVLDLFGVPWVDLTLEAVQSFLDGAEDEPLLWEAKGTKLDAHAVRKAVGAFANSHDGGYLILGAEVAPNGWQLTGLSFPTEPRLWLSDTIRAGLQPVPVYDVHPFEVGAGHVAVIQVLPLADPPCITRGTVYERVPGQSVPVKDPQRLADLYRRGEQAHEVAQADALQVCDALATTTLFDPSGTALSGTGFCVGLATAGRGADVVGSLFTRDFFEHLGDLIRSQSHFTRGLDSKQTQTTVWAAAPDAKPLNWAALATWNGAVALAANAPTQAYWPEQAMARHLVNAWAGLLDLAQRLGGGGSHAVAVRVKSSDWPASLDASGPTTLSLLRRGPAAQVADTSEQARIERELRRIAGYEAYEDD
jgi:hypothetical protein